MAGLGSYLFGSMKGGSLHDYGHAAQIFRTNNYTRAPKEKWMFQVNFVLDSQNNTFELSPAELSYLVKSVELPKFTMETKDMNQYNRKTWVQNRIKYEPVTIKFHDDNINGLREFWRSYYTYYFTDGNYQQNTYALDDRYLDNTGSPSWGLDSGASGPFLSMIQIYSLHGGTSNLISLMNPVITSFSHDSHDYSQTQEFMESTMQIHYTGVTYSQGYAAGIAGFADPAGYDTSPSDISGQYNGYVIDPATGNLVQANDQFVNPGLPVNYNRPSYYYNPTGKNGLTSAEINSILRNQNIQLNQFGFPVANTQTPTYSQNTPVLLPGGTTAYSNGQYINARDSIYPAGTVQNALSQMGYTPAQIAGATSNNPLINIATSVGSNLLGNAIKSLLSGTNNKTNTNTPSQAQGTDASPAQTTSATDINAVDTSKTTVPVPQARPANLGDTGTPKDSGGDTAYTNNQTVGKFVPPEVTKTTLSSLPGGFAQNEATQAAVLQQKVENITPVSEKIGQQISAVDAKQAQLDAQVASGQISDSIYEQKSAELAAQRSYLATQQNAAQISETQALSEAVNPANPQAGAQAAAAQAAAEAQAWDTPAPEQTADSQPLEANYTETAPTVDPAYSGDVVSGFDSSAFY